MHQPDDHRPAGRRVGRRQPAQPPENRPMSLEYKVIFSRPLPVDQAEDFLRKTAVNEVAPPVP